MVNTEQIMKTICVDDRTDDVGKFTIRNVQIKLYFNLYYNINVYNSIYLIIKLIVLSINIQYYTRTLNSYIVLSFKLHCK